MIENVSLELELNAVYFDQAGDNAYGANFNLLARWHFLARDRWSLYVDGGGGVMSTTERVPDRTGGIDRGSDFNFTPQGGVGLSHRVAENTRMLVGLRWHHISNARTHDENPARDSLLVYAGFSFAF
jgi:hypothetical protein